MNNGNPFDNNSIPFTARPQLPEMSESLKYIIEKERKRIAKHNATCTKNRNKRRKKRKSSY